MQGEILGGRGCGKVPVGPRLSVKCMRARISALWSRSADGNEVED